MRDQSVEETAAEVARLIVPRTAPRTDFVRDLRQDIQRTAVQKMGYAPAVPFQDMVIELRKLVRLLCKTLVPVCPSQIFVRSLAEDLDDYAHEMIVVRQRRARWLMLGGVLGSALSLLGVIAALARRRRQDCPRAKKPIGIV